MANVDLQLDVGAGILHASASPTLQKNDGTNFPVFGYAFAVNDLLSFRFFASKYGSGNVTVLLDWYDSATSGSATWGASIAALTPGDAQSILTDALATQATQATSTNGTANGLNRTSIAVSSLDSLAADDSVELRITLTANSLSGTPKPVLIGVTVRYSDT